MTGATTRAASIPARAPPPASRRFAMRKEIAFPPSTPPIPWKRRSTRRSFTIFPCGPNPEPFRNSLCKAGRTADSEVLRDLRFASLRGPDLRRWRIGRNSSIATSPALYRETARWACAIHRRFPEIEGLVWTSNRCDPDTAYLFFGDRVAAADFRIAGTRDGRNDATFLSDVREAGQRSGIVITV